jgi:hypothetical protein
MARFNKKYNYTQNKKCINSQCNNFIQLRIIGDTDSEDYNLPIPTDRRKIACSRECHKIWQKSISWEERVGKEFAAEFRKKMSILSSVNNPSTFPGVAEKISKGLKNYLAENPNARIGENNPFFGRKHSTETLDKWKESKREKWSYNQEQKERQTQRTPKKENHPNWRGGIANGEYGLEFNKNLKNTVKNLYHNACQICHTITDQLDVHHIDYNKKNNLIENLIPLCKICHGKTNYNREEWKKLLTKK